MKVQLTRDLALPLAKKGKEFWVELKTTGKDGGRSILSAITGTPLRFRVMPARRWSDGTD